MAGRPGKKPQQQQQQPPKTYDEFEDDGETGDDEVGDFESQEVASAGPGLRDWRDVEKYRERRELKKLVEDDLDEFLDSDVLSDAPSPAKDVPRKRRS